MRQTATTFRKAARLTALVAVLTLMIVGVTAAMPPAPELVARNAAARKAGLSNMIPSTSGMHELGIDTPDDFMLRKITDKYGRVQSAAATGPFRILAICVDFSDHVAQTNANFFDTLLFGSVSGTVHSFYDEISYSQLDLVTVNLPSTLGWKRAPQTYAYYVDGSYGMYGTYPHNAKKLVEEAADAVDAVVDFNDYDNDNDGYVDVLVVIHSGTGAELSGSVNDIWSHKWSITPRAMNDGAIVYTYTIQPEFWYSSGDMTPGVYAHELGHGFGLPDLYDTDGSSNGIGRWGIMASGSWNGSLGSSPAHPCAWSRIQMGFASPTNVTSNLTNQAIASVESGGPIYRLWTAGASSAQYFLVENRQRTGYDAGLPSSGLCIWHIDDAKTDNDDEWYPGLPSSTHYLVAMEQADGNYQLEHASSNGDAADLFPGTTSNTSFSSVTTPSSDSYVGGGTLVAVTNISSSASTMYADLIVGIAAGVDEDIPVLPVEFELAQNYPNPFNPGTNIQFSISRAEYARLDLFNVLGQHVTTLVDGVMEPGSHVVEWDGTDFGGHEAATGLYFYRLTIGDEQQTKKMLLVR